LLCVAAVLSNKFVMGGDAARAGDDDMSREKTAPLSAGQINQLLLDVAQEAYARADALTKLFDELEGDFEARAAAGGDTSTASDLRARLAELSRMEEELSVEFEKRLRDLDVIVTRRLATLSAGEGDAAATTASSGVEDSSAAAADLFEDGSD
jgi:hypothetical protein